MSFTVALQAQNIIPIQKKENKKIYETYSTTQYIKKMGCEIDLNYITTLESKTTIQDDAKYDRLVHVKE
jgi:hypothetical protein